MDIKNQSRENNVIFFGLETTPDMKPDECWNIITNCLKQRMQIENLFIDRAHILGRTAKPPIIVKFPRSYDRAKIFVRVHKLRNTPISIAQDFARETREARKELNAFRKSQNFQGERTPCTYKAHLTYLKMGK